MGINEQNHPNPQGNPGFWWRPKCHNCRTTLYIYDPSVDKVPVVVGSTEAGETIEHEYVCGECRENATPASYEYCKVCDEHVVDGKCSGCGYAGIKALRFP